MGMGQTNRRTDGRTYRSIAQCLLWALVITHNYADHVHSTKRKATVWCLSVCLFHLFTNVNAAIKVKAAPAVNAASVRVVPSVRGPTVHVTSVVRTSDIK